MSLPDNMSAENITWLRLQMTISASRATQPLREELNQVDGFLNGLLIAVAQLVPVFFEHDPKVAARMASEWKRAAERFEALAEGEAPKPDDEPMQHLEARQVLYRACEDWGLWAKVRPICAVRRAPHRTTIRHLKR